MMSPTPHYYMVEGRAAEIARALRSPASGAEHLFLAMLHDGGWPVSAISGLVDLARAEAAVHGIIDSAGYSPPTPPRFSGASGYVQPSWGARVTVEMGDSHLGLEHALLAAISDAVPEGATFGFNGRAETGETWIHVFGPGGSLGREVSREVLNTAQARLGRPGLGS